MIVSFITLIVCITKIRQHENLESVSVCLWDFAGRYGEMRWFMGFVVFFWWFMSELVALLF